MTPETAQGTPQPERAPLQGPEDRPGVFLISCYKCCREFELHGRQSLISSALIAEGWVKSADRRGMICPYCPCATGELYNKSRELARKARRFRYPIIQVAA